ncbi:putative mitochondrial FAD-linked sulfhydryl oxidase [Clavispora lusitaniae]|uniref:Mitochondrial FAD-linked sulfhydryl oxidase n=2 Tax=Clavispora lusitaniae TaxID=36911 RepID=A0ACD0WMN0_CLALS|nr:putative sulfhydryl oxidase [Clavispora lusitaniae]QFZ28596.1 putative mitochondrial FAD-linked sulfhydryl oxidase [Clavispora lusitaniae]QFZ34259.1 putative mitochondrial FAD-linked sulfhydryl oxidase [Clavispora lusitaniae]QFZ39943.1 putative mitochondrial FAD-linked sulfhydryl oxidase [Clavispora lusitaniae]QFZ45625.1 putative mitochondrial FAD-linked sulfhydryl oxidase [Clavispora lusitaniae]
MTQEVKNIDSEAERPVIGASGRKIVYDKDGKPCRACNTLLDFQMVSGRTKSKSKSTEPGAVSATPIPPAAAPSEREEKRLPGGYKKDYPPDVEKLGRSSWSLLHSIAATYPENPSSKQQSDLKQFLKLFGNFYPCWYCGEDFERYMEKKEPQTESQDVFGKWLCEAHNDVNKKLGKPRFDCNLWKQRWKDGWDE